MGTPNWLDQVERQLMKASVSVAYRTRLLDELRDHIEDLCCEERNHAMSAEAMNSDYLEKRLGKPLEVATAAANATRAQFALRHPIVTFLLLPVPLLLLLWVAYTMGLAGILSLFRSYQDANWAEPAASILIYSLAYVPAIVLTLIIAWVAHRSRARLTWWLTASALVAFVSGLLMVTFNMPTTPGTGKLTVGLGFPPDLSRWPQIIVPLAVAMAIALHVSFKQRADKVTAAM